MFRVLMKWVAVAALGCVLVACGDKHANGEADFVVLTVTGAITETNRPARDDFGDVMFVHRQIAFTNAYAFTYADLSALPAAELTVTYDNWGTGPVTVAGPRLRDVLDMVGADGERVSLQAVDGYTYDYDAAAITGDFVLAIRANGTPLPLGGHGPVWLVMPRAQSPAAGESDDGLVWGIYSIDVQSARD